ncbi:dihydrofolate reductase family protein [Mucilaginibacter sp.]|uniref:dihydrofolate reductase family protein n=1 Tax=Mucilaginibacter sp. TaxID=1882438 RepID=UPI003566A630
MDINYNNIKFMRRIILFNMITLDSRFEGPNGEIDWHNTDKEFSQFAVEQLETVDTLLFGRKTYQLMESFWPTEQAKQQSPVIAGLMNNAEKIVCSKTLTRVDWDNSRLITNIKGELPGLKNKQGKDIMIFGSADLSKTLIKLGLIDEIRLMLNPVVLGKGKPFFRGIKGQLNLQLLKVRLFNSGNILLYYKPLYK